MEVAELQTHYSSRMRDQGIDVSEEVRTLTDKYINRWELDAQAIAAGLAVDSLLSVDHVDVTAITPQMHEAFELAYPNVDLNNIIENPDLLPGYVSAWKGKLFEVNVRDQLSNGETVGGFHLDAGQHVQLADSATQPGWDLQILDDHNNVVELLQLKATDSISYVNEAMDRYPDIHVIATSNLADHADFMSGLSTAGISEEDLHQAIDAPFADVMDDDIWDHVLPALPLLLIAARQGLALFSGELTWPEALAVAITDAAKTGVAVGGGYLVGGAVQEIAGGVVEDIVGDVAADLLLGAVLPFGIGFLLRKLLGGSKPKPKLRTINKPELNEKLIREWVLPRALLVQKGVAKYYLPGEG